MFINKQELTEIIKDQPNKVDFDEVIYRLYLRKKLELAEQDICAGRLTSHEDVAKKTTKWFKR